MEGSLPAARRAARDLEPADADDDPAGDRGAVGQHAGRAHPSGAGRPRGAGPALHLAAAAVGRAPTGLALAGLRGGLGNAADVGDAEVAARAHARALHLAAAAVGD